MKIYAVIISALLCSGSLFAKKVRFAVNMAPQYLNGDSLRSTGVHVYGTFQVAAGYPYDLDPGSTVLTQETGDTNVYSIVVDVPAFHVYEYRFINGDQSYQLEFVPEESRVNGTFDDNRWMYVDSIANDTSFVGVIPYSMNAPVGLSLVVFRVNMSLQTVSTDGVHVAGSFQGWDPSGSTMVTFNDTVYRYQAYIPNGTYQYKFVNGKTTGDYENVGGACSVNGNREVVVTGDIVLDAYNFSSCIVGIAENNLATNIHLFPNPSAGNSRIQFNDNDNSHEVSVADLTGRMIQHYSSTEETLLLKDLDAGVYLITIRNSEPGETTLRYVVQ